MLLETWGTDSTSNHAIMQTSLQHHQVCPEDFLRNIFIKNQQNYIMYSRSERHKEYNDSRTDNKNKKKRMIMSKMGAN